MDPSSSLSLSSSLAGPSSPPGPAPASAAPLPDSEASGPGFIPQEEQENDAELDWESPDASFGPSHFARTRAQWLSGSLHSSSSSPSSSRRNSKAESASGASADAMRRLSEVLNTPGVETDSNMWARYLSEVHGKVVGGSKVKKGFGLEAAVKLLRIGWMRDGTWFGEENAAPSTTAGRSSLAPIPVLSARSPAHAVPTPRYLGTANSSIPTPPKPPSWAELEVRGNAKWNGGRIVGQGPGNPFGVGRGGGDAGNGTSTPPTDTPMIR